MANDMHDQIESSFSFPFAEVETRVDLPISASGIHQKDPHVSGVTKSQGGEGAEEQSKARVNRSTCVGVRADQDRRAIVQ